MAQSCKCIYKYIRCVHISQFFSSKQKQYTQILSTKEYFAFCERFNKGEYIHHDPSMTDVPARYTLTWTKYSGLFGSYPKDLAIWPQCEFEESSEEEGDYLDDFGCG